MTAMTWLAFSRALLQVESGQFGPLTLANTFAGEVCTTSAPSRPKLATIAGTDEDSVFETVVHRR